MPFVHLRAAGVSLVLHSADDRVPAVLHWGHDLGADLDVEALAAAVAPPPDRRPDAQPRLSLVPQQSEAWSGRPGLAGSRGGQAWSPALRVTGVDATDDRVTITATDPAVQVTVTTTVGLDRHGVLTLRHTLSNDGAEPYTLHDLGLVLPVPPVVGELLDFTGRWALERQPQRRPADTVGSWQRELRHGRTGFESPLVLVAGTPGFGSRTGEVWGVHLGWSGDSRWWFDRTQDGFRTLGAGELFAPSGLSVGPGERYDSPTLFASWSDVGLDGLADRFHDHLRARPGHPAQPRPVVFNTWEAVYFDQSFETLAGLAEKAAAVGAERFVLDDGWFRGRRDDTAGLGDWWVDPQVWPEGLTPLIERVRALGMEFGLWFEPEMANPDSDLLRAHPDWALQVAGHDRLLQRHQLVLDVSRPEVWAYLFERIDTLLTEHDIAYVKWDHNRDLLDAGGSDGAAAGHANVLAVYRLLDALRDKHPAVEIESCSSGGGRVDLGVLARTDRVWASDSIDAVDRHPIQRWTALLLPPELAGSHIGGPRTHTTGRRFDLAFRAAAPLLGSLGIEWDISTASDDEIAALAGIVAEYKRLRPLLHSGRVVHGDLPAGAQAMLHGVVAQEGSEAVFCFAQLASPPLQPPPPVRLPGLDPRRSYTVTPLVLPSPTSEPQPPTWLRQPLRVSGSALTQVGLAVPRLNAEQAVLVTLIADEG